MTGVERRLWARLRRNQLGSHFRRQAPIGPYVVDFACLSAHLIIEVDGPTHDEAREPRDETRQRWLERRGHDVLRFTADDVFWEIDNVIEAIEAALEASRALRRCP